MTWQGLVAAEGAVPLLVKLLTTNNAAQGYAAAALCNLAQHADARDALVAMSGEGTDPLVAISHGPESWLRSQAVGILDALNKNNHNKVDVPEAQKGPPIKMAVQKPCACLPRGEPPVIPQHRASPPVTAYWRPAHFHLATTHQRGYVHLP